MFITKPTVYTHVGVHAHFFNMVEND